MHKKMVEENSLGVKVDYFYFEYSYHAENAKKKMCHRTLN